MNFRHILYIYYIIVFIYTYISATLVEVTENKLLNFMTTFWKTITITFGNPFNLVKLTFAYRQQTNYSFEL